MYSPKFNHKALTPLFKTLISCSIHSSRKPILSDPAIQFALNEAEQQTQSSKPQFSPPTQKENHFHSQEKDRNFSKVQISHPWAEWVDLMKVLLKKGYFDGTGNPFVYNGELGKKQANLVRMACLNFARDHYQLIRYLSRDDIMVIAESGCPNTDRKVVNSGKRLRAYVGIVEGNVCSSCILRGDCDRAYVKAREDEGGRTVDVMRLLLTYCLDPILGSVENKPCLNKKVQESVRTLVKEMVVIRVEECDHEMSKASHSEGSKSTQDNDSDEERKQINVPMKKGDWICAKCDFLNFAQNVKCLRCDTFNEERLRMVAAEQDNLPLKKGDWICNKCKFLNFARNTKCHQCKEKVPARKLNPGEWECESCNYLNFRRNMVCLKCDYRRPVASNAGNNTTDHEIRPSFENKKRNSTNHKYPTKFTEDGPDFVSNTRNTDIMDFTIIGGRSNLSRKSWEPESGKKGLSTVYLTSDDESGSGSDNEMAEWFKGGKKLR